MFSFDKLPDAYIADNREALPTSYKNLRDEVQHLFSITDRAELKNLAYYRETLQKYYFVQQILAEYFDLPAPKRPLPSTLQNLTPRLREKFLFLPANQEDFKEHVRLLRVDYSFTRLPNDYIISRRRLLLDPVNLKMPNFAFLLQSTEEVNTFIKSVPQIYNISTLLPQAYCNFNYTNLSDLPEDANSVTCST